MRPCLAKLMKKLIIYLSLVLFITAAQAENSINVIRLTAANSAVDTGIIDELIEVFEKKHPPFQVSLSKVGGISALERIKQGEADLVITHYPSGEKLLIADGYANNRTYLMYNNFAIFGDSSNQYNILPSQDLTTILQKLANEQVNFMYPGANSATYRRLTELWSSAGIDPGWPGYEGTGTSTGRTLVMASLFNTFAFSDMATYSNNQNEISEMMIPLYRDHELLRNYYSIITPNPEKFTDINIAGSSILKDFLISDEAQTLIRNYGIEKYGHAIYFPAASLDANLNALKKERLLKEKSNSIKEKEEALYLTKSFALLLLIALTILAVQYYKFKHLQRRKRQDDERYKLVIEGSNDGIIDWDVKNESLYLSERMLSMIELDKDKEYTDFIKDVLSKVQEDYKRNVVSSFSLYINAESRSGSKIFITDCPFELGTKNNIWLNIRCKILTDENHIPTRMVGAATDISQIKEQQFLMEHQALHDPLTKLPNRRLFEDRLKQAISLAKRHNKYISTVAVLMIDLDNFKNINDTHGHHIGDKVLKTISEKIQSQLREHDTLARLGGDEFGILLPHTDDLRANHVAQKLLLSFKRPVTVDHHTLPVSGSIGIAIYPDHGLSTEALIKHVDVAMYSAKKTKTGAQIYNIKDDLDSSRRLKIEKDLVDAIENNELEIHYQPKVDLRRKRIIGAEALLRWNHPEEGNIGPEEIIEIAENSGLIGILTDWVVYAVFTQVAVWSSQGTWLPIAINLSVLNLQDGRLIDHIETLLTQFNIEPEQIEFEITESAMMYNPEMALQSIMRLSEMNIPMSIDDFGTGFSSMIYLKELPVQALKIDREFIKDILEDNSDKSIVRATIDLGHSLKLNVIAEGVEDADTLHLLSELGCDMIQGYFISRPLRVAAFDKFIHESAWAIPAPDDSKNIIKIHDKTLH